MIDEQKTVRMPIASMEDVIRARRQGLQLASTLGFPLPEATMVAVVISELGRNIFLYAKMGTVTLTVYSGMVKGITIVAEDHGPGIKDLAQVLKGGHSTSRGLGMGLAGSGRLMDEFDVQTEVGVGTTVRATKWLRHGSRRP